MDTPDGPVLVRIPVSRAAQMDLRLWPEPDVLGVVTAHIEQVPRLLHVSADPVFQVHEYVPGHQLNHVAPRGSVVPEPVIPAVLDLFDRLAGIPRDELPPLPAGWPEDGRGADFAHLLSAYVQRVYDEHRESWGGLFRSLGIPDDPLGAIRARWSGLTARPFRLLHADVHRRNLLVCPGDRPVVFLDWELALYGDPVYELAVHLNKMGYLDQESHRLLSGWAARADPATGRGWHRDLDAYLRFERIKTAIVHTVRYTRMILDAGTGDIPERDLLAKLTGNLNAAGACWGWRGTLSASQVKHAILVHREQIS